MRIILLGLFGIICILSFVAAHPLPFPCSDVAGCVKRSINSPIADNTAPPTIESLQAQIEQLNEQSVSLGKDLEAILGTKRRPTTETEKLTNIQKVKDLVAIPGKIEKLEAQIAGLLKKQGGVSSDESLAVKSITA